MRLLSWCCFLLLPFVGLAQSKTERQILAAEQHRFEAMVRRDTVALRSMLADDLIYIHSNAMQENKSAHISAISSGRLAYNSMLREKASVRRYGKKTAFVNGVVQVKGIINANPFEVRLLYTAVYRRVHKTWILVNWQSTKML